MDFRVKMIRILNKLKEAMECTAREIRNKNEKNTNRNVRSENVIDKMKYWKILLAE